MTTPSKRRHTQYTPSRAAITMSAPPDADTRTDYPNHPVEEAYRRLFQFFHAESTSPYWYTAIQRGHWPVNHGDLTDDQLRSIAIKLAGIFGIRVNPRRAAINPSTVFKKLLLKLHPDKVHSQLFGNIPIESINFRHHYAATQLAHFCNQVKPLTGRDASSRASSQYEYPLPIYTSRYDPHQPSIYTGQRVTPFDALATIHFESIINSLPGDRRREHDVGVLHYNLKKVLDEGVRSFGAPVYRDPINDGHEIFERHIGTWDTPFIGMIMGHYRSRRRRNTTVESFVVGELAPTHNHDDDGQDTPAQDQDEPGNDPTGERDPNNQGETGTRDGNGDPAGETGAATGNNTAAGEETNRDQGGENDDTNTEGGHGDMQFTPGRYDCMPTDAEVDGNVDCLPTRPRASDEDISRDPFAVVDHLNFRHCYGSAGGSFRESEGIPPQCRFLWAASFGKVCEAVSDALALNPHEHGEPPDFKVKLERRIKFFFLFPSLMLRKPVMSSESNNRHFQKTIRARLNQFHHNEWRVLISDFERDMVRVSVTDKSEFASKRDQRDINFQRAAGLIQVNQLRRARQAMLSTGCSDPSDPVILAQMTRKFPSRKTEIAAPSLEQFQTERAVLHYDTFREVVRLLKPKTSPGMGCLRNEHLTALLFNKRTKAPPAAQHAFAKVHRLCNEVVLGQLPWYFYKAWTATSLSAVNKLDPESLADGQVMDCRPVAKGNSLRKAVTKALYLPYEEDIIDETSPTQYGCGEKAGGTKMVYAIQLMIEANPNFVCIALDVSNAYNEIERSKVLDQYWDRPRVRPLWYYQWRCKMIKSEVGLGSGERMERAPFTSAEGEQQGATDSGANFCIVIDPINRATNSRIGRSGGMLTGGIDDTYLLGPPEVAFEILRDHEMRLKDVGLSLNRAKTKCYIKEQFRLAEFHILRGDIGLGTMGGIDGMPSTFGVPVYGVPVGDDAFINAFLQKKGTKITGEMRLIGERMHPLKITSPEVPARQCLWQLILRCMQFRGSYWCRHLPTDTTLPFCESIDVVLDELIQIATGLDISSDTLSDFTRKRVRLPIRMKGLGVRKLADRRFCEYVGGAVQGITTLFNRVDDIGNLIVGRIQVPSMVEWVGRDSFDAGTGNRWSTLMPHDSRIGQSIQVAWNELTSTWRSTFEKMGIDHDNGSIMANHPERAGFASNGKFLQGSVTRIIAEEIEKGKSRLLQHSATHVSGDGSLFLPTTRERLAYNNCDTFSAQFVGALPCPLGIMQNNVLLEAFAQYFGQPSPAMRPFVDGDRPHYIGRRGKEQVVDEFGDSVARAQLNGGDFIRSHEAIKIVLNGIMRKSGFTTWMEALNMFHGLVPWEILRHYCDAQTSKDAIIPDILMHNYPSDANGNGNAVMSAIFDVKTVRVDKRGSFYRAGTHGNGATVLRAVKKKSAQCRRSYLTAAGKLDAEFAPGDADRPFTSAITRTFATGNVIPIVCGAFGEVNVECHRHVELFATYAAALEDNSDITPEEIRSAKGSPYNLLLSQFRRAIGCLAMRTAIEEKLRRTHLIRANKHEANTAAESGMGNHRRAPNSCGPGWYHNYSNERLFQEFYRYQTQYDHFYTEDRNSAGF